MMPSIHRVIKYSGLNYNEALQLPCDTFKLMLKNSIIEELNATEEGKEYLDKCNRLNTTQIDKKGFKKMKKS